MALNENNPQWVELVNLRDTVCQLVEYQYWQREGHSDQIPQGGMELYEQTLLRGLSEHGGLIGFDQFALSVCAQGGFIGGAALDWSFANLSQTELDYARMAQEQHTAIQELLSYFASRNAANPNSL